MNKAKDLYDKIVHNRIAGLLTPRYKEAIKEFYYDWYQNWLRTPEEKDEEIRYRELSEFLSFLQGEIFDFPMNKVWLNSNRYTPEDLLLDLRNYLRAWYSTDQGVLRKVKACLSNLLGRTESIEDSSSSYLRHVIQEVDSLLDMLEQEKEKASTSGASL